MKTSLLFSALMLSVVAAPVFADGTRDAHKAYAAAKLLKVDRTITVDMTDNMRFTPARISVRRGETIRFLVKNSGQLKHEMVIGSTAELKEHAEMMRNMPEMAHADEDQSSSQVTVEPGETGEIVQHFTKAGTYDFACLQPGHFEAGMKGLIAVKERQ
jgi:uncharacterized cupredoxin-like copper-binding protein